MKGTIIYYGGFSLPDKNAAANRVVSNGKIFKELGYKVVFLGADYEGNGYSGIREINNEMWCESHPTGVLQWVKQLLIFSNLKNLVKNEAEAKLVILYNAPFITLLLAKLFLKCRGIEAAYDCTEWTQVTDGSAIKKIFKFVDEIFIRRLMHRIADRVIVISDKMLTAYKKNKRLIKLPPLVDLSQDMWHQAVGMDDSKFTFCFAGFPDGNKDYIDVVVKAFSSLDCENARLNIVGVTEDQFRALYADVEINGNVEFLGKVSHNESIKQILLCDCYVFIRPSDRRNNAGFPTKFVESFTCGGKIITTDVSDVKKYADDDCLILDSTDLSELQTAMRKVIDENNVSEKKALRDTFDYRNYIDKTKIWLD